MKKIVLTFIITISLLSSLFATNPEFEWVNTLRYESMSNLSIRGVDTVIVVGGNGLVAKSVNHGQNWSKQYLATNIMLRDVVFCNSTLVLAVGDKGIIFKSMNAGLNWSKISSGTTYNIKAIAATGMDNIWAVGDSSLVLHSTDSGQTWQKMNLTSSIVSFTDVDFKNANGFIIGSSGMVFKTINDGGNWSQVTSAAIADNSSYYNSLSMTEHRSSMINNYYSYNNTMFSTVDNTNWTQSTLNLFGGINGLHYVNDTLAYITTVNYTTCGCGDGYITVYKTKNGGSNWSTVYNTRGNWGSEFKFSNTAVGYFLNDVALYIIPATGEFGNQIYNALKETYEQPAITIKQFQDKLIINSASKSITAVEIRIVTGSLVVAKNNQNSLSQQELNTQNLPKGIYLIRTLFDDNTTYSQKWIKY